MYIHTEALSVEMRRHATFPSIILQLVRWSCLGAARSLHVPGALTSAAAVVFRAILANADAFHLERTPSALRTCRALIGVGDVALRQQHLDSRIASSGEAIGLGGVEDKFKRIG